MEVTGEGACVLSPFVLVAIIVLIKPPSHHRITEIAIYESTKRNNEQRAEQRARCREMLAEYIPEAP